MGEPQAAVTDRRRKVRPCHGLYLVPVSQRLANEAVARWHRH